MERGTVTVFSTEEQKARLYKIFYEDNKELFAKDRQEFMFQQHRYVEKGMTNWRYGLNPKENDAKQNTVE